MSAKNFIIKNGLTIGSTEAIDSSGDLTAAAFGTAANEAIDDRVNALLTAGTGISLSYDDSAGTLTITGQQGDITGIVAGTGLTGDASSGEATLNVVGGTGITANANDIEVDTSVVTTLSGTQTLTNKTLTTPIINGTVSGTAIKDEDDMTSNSSTHLASQQSIKAYVDAQVATKDNTDEITEGSSNLYFTNARADARIANAIKDEDNMASDSATHVPSQQSVKAFVEAQVATKDNTDEITEGSSNLYFTNERVDDRVGALLTAGTGISLSYDDAAGSLTITGQQGDITSVVAGTGLTDGGTSGDVTLNVVGGDGITANANDIALSSTVAGNGLSYSSGVLAVGVDDSSIELDSDAVQVKAGGITNAMLAGSIAAGKLAGSIGNSLLSNSAITIDGTSVSLGGSITTNNTQLSTEQVQDITGAQIVSNGSHTGISFAYDDANDGAIDATVSLSPFDTDNLSEGSSNLYYTNARADARVNLQTGSNLNLSSKDTDDLSEGTSNLYFTNERVDDRVNALVTAGSGITKTYNDSSNTLTIASSITQYADSDARGAISVTDSGGDGSLAYNSGTGVITYTGPSASEVRAHITAGTGVSISSGQVSIGQAVATSSNVTFGDVTVSGDLTVNGDSSTVSSTNTTITDALIELANGTSGNPSNDVGIVIERGSDSNQFIGWDDSASRFTVASGTFTGASTGALSLEGNEANFRANQITTSYANNSGGVARNIYQSTSAPTGSDGAVGDLWILYS